MSGAENPWAAWAAHVSPPGPAPLGLETADFPPPEGIPPREWLYGTRLIRRFVSVLAAPGGVGKSSLALAQALALASGRGFLGEHVHHSVPAWVFNLEDPLEETQRRVAALMRLHDIPPDSLAGRLFLNTGRTRRLVMADLDSQGAIAHPDREAVVEAAQQAGIGLIVVDPFVKSHRLDENSNAHMDAAATAWAEVAERTGCAVLLVHHVRKGAAEGVDATRGAKSLTDAARSASMLSPMSQEDAQSLSVPERERWRYVRLDDAKANLAPRPDAARWFRLETVALGNGNALYPTATAWPPSPPGPRPARSAACRRPTATGCWTRSPPAMKATPSPATAAGAAAPAGPGWCWSSCSASSPTRPPACSACGCATGCWRKPNTATPPSASPAWACASSMPAAPPPRQTPLPKGPRHDRHDPRRRRRIPRARARRAPRRAVWHALARPAWEPAWPGTWRTAWRGPWRSGAEPGPGCAIRAMPPDEIGGAWRPDARAGGRAGTGAWRTAWRGEWRVHGAPGARPARTSTPPW